MSLPEGIRRSLAAALAALLACSPARALVALNDGRDRIYVNGSVSVSRDSNVFASSNSAGDYVYSTSLSAEYTRRAGWIGVNANVGVSSSKFATIEGQDFANPNVGLEFVKQSGRTTGSLTLSASRQSRADASVNTRVESWNYNVGLGVKYPVTGTLSLAGNFGYANTLYTGGPRDLFSDLASYSAGIDAFHVFTSDRDLFGGYRFRYGETSRSTSFTDHSISGGISGKVIRGVKGSLRLGYQFRIPSGITVVESRFSSWTAGGSLTYAFSKLTNLSLGIAKDFSTTATDSFVDSLTVNLDIQHAFTSRFGVSGGVAYGDSHFLGQGGRVVLAIGPPVEFGPNRRDSYFSWNTAVNYSFNEHLRLSATYSWFRNWSASSFADFIRSGYSLSASSRW